MKTYDSCTVENIPYEHESICLRNAVLKGRTPMGADNVNLIDTTITVDSHTAFDNTYGAFITSCTVEADGFMQNSRSIMVQYSLFEKSLASFSKCKSINIINSTFKGANGLMNFSNAINMTTSTISGQGDCLYDASNVFIFGCDIDMGSGTVLSGASNVTIVNSTIKCSKLLYNTMYVTLMNCRIECDEMFNYTSSHIMMMDCICKINKAIVPVIDSYDTNVFEH